MRLLDAAGIGYEMREYEVDESDLSAAAVARKIGFPEEQVFKTLVAQGDKTGVLLCCVPGDEELNLKEIAAASGNKKVEMTALKDLLGLTGYIRGGVSPVGTKKPYPVFIRKSAFDFDAISISAGQRGMQMIVAPKRLSEYLKAKEF